MPQLPLTVHRRSLAWAGQIRRLWRQRSSLQLRLILISVIALAPLVLLMLGAARDERANAMSAARERATLLASIAVETQDDVIDQAKALLTFLAGAPEVHGGGRACDAYLARFVSLHRWVDSLRVANLKGEGLCANVPEVKAVNTLDRGYFQEAIAGAPFTVSEILTSKRTNAPAMFAAAPVMLGGRVDAVVTVGINLTAFGSSKSRGWEDDSQTMMVFDRNGSLIAHRPPRPELVGQSFGELPVVKQALQRRDGVVEMPDLFGREQLFAFRTLPGTDAVLAIGLDKESIVEPIEEALRRRLLWIATIAALAVLVLMGGGEILVFHPINLLARTAKALEQGDLAARSRIPGGGEVVALSAALDRMADAIADRERRLVDAESLFRALFENATDRLIVNRIEPDGSVRIEMLNLAAATPMGISPADAAGKRYNELVAPEAAARVEANLQRTIALGEPIRFQRESFLDLDKQIWEIVLIPLRNAEGRIDRVFGGARDISELKRPSRSSSARRLCSR